MVIADTKTTSGRPWSFLHSLWTITWDGLTTNTALFPLPLSESSQVRGLSTAHVGKESPPGISERLFNPNAGTFGSLRVWVCPTAPRPNRTPSQLVLEKNLWSMVSGSGDRGLSARSPLAKAHRLYPHHFPFVGKCVTVEMMDFFHLGS